MKSEGHLHFYLHYENNDPALSQTKPVVFDFRIVAVTLENVFILFDQNEGSPIFLPVL